MSTICPKCGYERKANDVCPDSECPQCGIVYEKYRRQQVEPGKKISNPMSNKSGIENRFVKIFIAAICTIPLIIWEIIITYIPFGYKHRSDLQIKAEETYDFAPMFRDLWQWALRKKEP